MLDVVRNLRSFGTVEALVVDDERVTYRELADQVGQTAGWMRELGMGPGARLGVLLPNTATTVRILLAAWDLGVVVVPMNTRYRSQELRYVIAHSDVDVLVTAVPGPGQPDLAERLRAAFPGLATQTDPFAMDLPEAPDLRSIVLLGAQRPVAGFVPDRATRPGPPIDGEPSGDELLLVYTSGTTANPKGVVHSLTAFVETGRHTARSMRLRGGDVLWDPLPLFHTGGLLPMLGALDVGATYVSSSHFDAGRGLRTLVEERVTAAYVAFSTLVTSLLDHPDFPAADFPALRWILAIGPEALLERVQRELPDAVQVSCYGCTEVGGVMVYNDMDDPAEVRRTTCGRAFPGMELRIVDGEIQVRGDSVLRRYHRDQSPPVDAEGWFATGDLGALDPEGRLSYSGRRKDMFKIGGENVAASEIELVLVEHPAVTFAQVVSVPDARLTEVAAAFVELRPGAAVEPEALVAFCAERLASFKVPRHVRVVDSWPMSATKVQKFALRERILAELGMRDTGLPASTGA